RSAATFALRRARRRRRVDSAEAYGPGAEQPYPSAGVRIGEMLIRQPKRPGYPLWTARPFVRCETRSGGRATRGAMATLVLLARAAEARSVAGRSGADDLAGRRQLVRRLGPRRGAARGAPDTGRAAQRRAPYGGRGQ